MELTHTLFTCLISVNCHLFDVNVFNVTFGMRARRKETPLHGLYRYVQPERVGLFSTVLVINRARCLYTSLELGMLSLGSRPRTPPPNFSGSTPQVL